jgi:hypothetical protein
MLGYFWLTSSTRGAASAGKYRIVRVGNGIAVEASDVSSPDIIGAKACDYILISKTLFV